jgi:dihydrofolate reductase
MRRVVVTEFISVDGVIEAPGGGEDFDRGGWAFQFDRGDEGNKFKLDELFEADAQLLGRRTYEGFAAAWPSRPDDEAGFTKRMNGMPKYVVSNTLEDPSWENTIVLAGDAAEAVRKLKEDGDGVVLIAGSAQLVQALTEAGLVDEYRLMVFPIILASGMRLLDETADATTLELVGTQSFDNGVVNLTYRPTRAAGRRSSP